MKNVIGAIFILAASVLEAAGIVADAVRPMGDYGTPGHVMGILLGLVGLAVFASDLYMRPLDDVAVDKKPPE